MNSLELLEQQLAYEQETHRHTQSLLEKESLLLDQSNKQLRHLNEQLVQQIKTQEGQRQTSENRYRQLVESVRDIIFKISPEGYFTFVNSRMVDCLGYTQSELVGWHFINLVLPNYRVELISFYQTMIRTGQSDTYIEFPVRAKDGHTVWIGQTVGLVDDDQHIPELVAVARDITKRKHAEDDFLTTQARLASLITNLHTGVLVEDENRTIILVNQLYCDLFGITQAPEVLVGLAFVPVAVPAPSLFTDAMPFRQQMDEAVNKQCAVINEVISLADGRMLTWTYIPIWLDGHYRGHLWQYTDITEKYRSDERIRKSDEKYRGIMNSMELGLLEVDNNQTILRAYERCCNMLGYTEDELVGKNAANLLVPPEFRQVVNGQQGQRRQGNAGSYELPLIRKDGSRIWVLISGVPITNEQGVIVGSMGIHYDLSERKRLEEELYLAKQIAEEVRYTEKQFLANMSHEIRTPLNAIIGFSTMMETTLLDAQQQEFAGFIRTAGKNLLIIVNDILDISKIEAGMLSLESIPFSIHLLADSIRTMLHSMAADKNLHLVVETDSTLPSAVLGDPTRLTQILVNLLSNAIKFTKQGGVTMRIEKQAETDGVVQVRFSVQDTGIGMAADVLPYIFERFRQASDFTTRHYGGTGLGLNIVKSLTELQGGWVTVSSTPGEGSCLTVQIPYKVAPQQIEPVADESVAPSSTDTGDITILVVEDNIMNQKLALQVLKHLGYSAQVAENGQQALEKLQETNFDLVLMDIQMPVMDGYTTTRHIRNTLRSAVPIIAMTAHALASEREQCLQAGMNDFIPKPFQIEELQRIIRKYAPNSGLTALPEKPIKKWVEPASSFSFETLLHAVDDDREFAIELLDLFMVQTPAQVQAIRQALEQNNLATIGGIIHTQKASFKVFGLTELVRLGQLVEASIAANIAMAEVIPLVNRYMQTLDVELAVIRSHV
ncbi:PAS domain-containing hybrid sensor histidine kinase/response regulator [Spirosoma flavum]|uniref:histidine kinase n=1 Tax=Spirosoma flavum TaxID=2048557 RepID=A0ABW6AHU6_9BACT